MDAWGALGSSEYGDVWDRFERVFNVRPTVRPAGLAGIDALPRVGIQQRMLIGTDVADPESAVLAAFGGCTPPQGRTVPLLEVMDGLDEPCW